MKLSLALAILLVGSTMAVRLKNTGGQQQGGQKQSGGQTGQQGGGNLQASSAGFGIDANQFCFDCMMRQSGGRDLFANPLDCHSYYQCQLLNETTAIGLVRLCPPGTFFDESRLVCRAEGPMPCQPSPCDNPTIAALGCYQLPGQSCRSYFTCAFNETRCCPEDTRFNPNTCGCDADATCTDFCQTVPTATQAPTFNDTACTDAFGNTLLPVDGRPDLFQLGDSTLACATGSTFDITTCACSTAVNLTEAQLAALAGTSRQATLWMPFETSLNDESVNHYPTFAYGDAALDTTTAASGSGSLRVVQGHLEIPGLKNIEMYEGNGISWCFSFRCGTASPYTCTTNGGILSNNRDASATVFSFIGAIFGANTLVSRVQTDFGEVNLNSQVTGGWNSACVIYRDNSTVELWLNGVQSGSAALSGPLTVSHCPYAVGHDQFYGFFTGNIDNVLIANSALSATEIQALAAGNTAALQSAGLIPAPSGGAVTSPSAQTTQAPLPQGGNRQQGGMDGGRRTTPAQGGRQTGGGKQTGGKQTPRENGTQGTGRGIGK